MTGELVPGPDRLTDQRKVSFPKFTGTFCPMAIAVPWLPRNCFHVSDSLSFAADRNVVAKQQIDNDHERLRINCRIIGNALGLGDKGYNF